MAPRPELPHTRDAVAERRARVMELTRCGWPAWQIAFEMRVTERTVQRYRDNERTGRPPGKPPWQPDPNRLKQIELLMRRGFSERAMARLLQVNKSTIYRYKQVLRESAHA